jgi:hypothetical protein
VPTPSRGPIFVFKGKIFHMSEVRTELAEFEPVLVDPRRIMVDLSYAQMCMRASRHLITEFEEVMYEVPELSSFDADRSAAAVADLFNWSFNDPKYALGNSAELETTRRLFADCGRTMMAFDSLTAQDVARHVALMSGHVVACRQAYVESRDPHSETGNMLYQDEATLTIAARNVLMDLIFEGNQGVKEAFFGFGAGERRWTEGAYDKITELLMLAY